MSPLFGENKRHKKVWRHTGKSNGAAVLLRLLLMLLLLLYIWTPHKKKYIWLVLRIQAPEKMRLTVRFVNLISSWCHHENMSQGKCACLVFWSGRCGGGVGKSNLCLNKSANWAVLPRVLLLVDENQTVRPPSSCVSTATGKRWRPLNSLCVRRPFCSRSEDGGGR